MVEEATAMPLQVDQAGKRSEYLLKQHTEGKGPGDEEAPKKDQEPTTPDEQSTLQKKFDVLKGKYEKEIQNADLKDLQRLKSENSVLKGQLNELTTAMQANTELLKDLQTQLDKKPAEPAVDPDAPVDLASILGEEDLKYMRSEEFDDKSLQIIAKLSQKAGVQNLTSQLAEVTQKVETVEKRIESTENVQHQTTIQTHIPDFEKINNMKEFHEWLDTPVSEFSKRLKRDDLQDSYARGDFESVKMGINAFKKEAGLAGEKPKKKEIDLDIEPDEDFSGDGEISPQKVYTLAEVKKFYAEQTKGRWVGREKQAAAIDADILKAQAEGRIKP